MLSASLEFDDKNFKKLFGALESIPEVRLGVFGGAPHKDKDGGDGEGLTNAKILSWHEFGVITTTEEGSFVKLPERSVLREPIERKLVDAIKETKSLDITTVLEDASFDRYFYTLGALALNIVRKNFNDPENGWPPLSPATLARKKTKQALIETKQMFDSITFEVTNEQA